MSATSSPNGKCKSQKPRLFYHVHCRVGRPRIALAFGTRPRENGKTSLQLGSRVSFEWLVLAGMCLASGNRNRAMRQRSTKQVLARIAALVLIFGVLWLWTFAKNSRYQVKSNLRGHVHAAMKLGPSPAFPQAVPLALASAKRIAPPKPRFQFALFSDPQIQPQERAEFTTALQHRPPPSQRA